MADDYVVADTTVISYLSKASPQSKAYEALLGQRRLAVSFQTRAELLALGVGEARQRRVNDLLAATLILPHSEATDVWYSRVLLVRNDLRRSGRPRGDAGEADVWIIASALEHGLPLLSHDKGQVHLGRAAGLRVVTNLEGLREDNPSL